jgi:CBS domain-containing protein
MAFLVITYGLPLAFRLPMVKDHLSSSVISVDVEDNLQTVAQLLSGNRITGAPVVEDGTVIGILSRNDLLRAICTVPTDASDQVKEESLDKIRATKVGFMRSYRTPPDTTRTPKSPIASLTLTLAPTLTRSGRCARTSASL